MHSHLPLRRFLTGIFALAIFVWCSPAAMAQADPPGRVGRLNHEAGSVTFAPAGDNEWVDAQPNRPLVRGDRLWTERGSRAEIQIGSSAVRLDGQTRLEIMALDDRSTQLSLTQGSVYLRVRSLPEGENFEIDTPNLAYRAAYPGDYRIDVDANDATTRVTIHSGTGAVYGEAGRALALGGGQQIIFRGRALAQVATQESPPLDAFDKWSAERNRLEDQSISARYVPREVVGYQQLDAHGQWKKDATYGAVWFPLGTPAGWAPYRAGRWEWIGPWGWTWIDDAPWGFAPFHYGRWALVESRWAWVPGQLGLRPVYAPALVAFVGNAEKGLLTSLAGQSGVAWFPLAPGEMWQPGFQASGAYISSVNRNMLPGASEATYAYQRRPEALTSISGDDFQRGRPAGASWLRIAANALTNASVVPPPAMPLRVAAAAQAKVRAAPPAQSDVRRVNADAAKANENSAARERGAAQRAAQAAAVEQARAAEQAKASEQATAQQAKAAELAKAAAQAKAQAKAAEQANAAQQARAAAQSRSAEQAKRAEQARLAALAQSKAAQQARRTQQAEALAREAAAKAQASRRQAQARRSETAGRERAAALTQGARREQALAARPDRQQREAARNELARREQQAQRVEAGRRQAQTKHDERLRLAARTRRNEQQQQLARAQQVEQARRAADHEARMLREQRLAREAQARREADERDRVERQREAAAAQQRREQQARDDQQRQDRARNRPDLRNPPGRAPEEVWQRGIPILNLAPTS